MNLENLDVDTTPGMPAARADRERNAQGAGDIVAATDARQRVRAITSTELFADHAEVRIAHRGGVYRLQQTSLGKLILTK